MNENTDNVLGLDDERFAEAWSDACAEARAEHLADAESRAFADDALCCARHAEAACVLVSYEFSDTVRDAFREAAAGLSLTAGQLAGELYRIADEHQDLDAAEIASAGDDGFDDRARESMAGWLAQRGPRFA
jgi:hypothetical protein